MPVIPPDTVSQGQLGHVQAHQQISDVLAAHDAQLQGIPLIRAGRATLSGGSVAVALPSVTSSTVIVASRLAPSGTLGHLSVPSVSPGTGFTIASSSSSEASSVAWAAFG